jgi:uncharacterized protein YbjQ (UPF0145 family)
MSQEIDIEIADNRLADTRSSKRAGTFTSDLTVEEFSLLDELGYEPLGFVMGTSIYHVGIQIARWGTSQELTVLSQAMYSARELAEARMVAEAKELGADGIVGVDISIQMYVWGQEVLEFIATGTAVAHPVHSSALRRSDGSPFTSDLSVQQLYLLATKGYSPTAFCLGTCVYHVAHQSGFASLRQMGRNQEMVTFTQDIYTARELALSRMQSEAKHSGADGVVGVSLSVSNHIWGEHATEFLALGTAIKRLEAGPLTGTTQVILPLA